MFLVTGSTGFIGSALSKALPTIPVEVSNLPRVHADYFLHFGAPSSQVLFNENDLCIKETITDFIKVVEYCKRRHLKLIFPSSSSVYTGINSYAHTKLSLENIAKAYGVNFLALRIFAGYGPGEEHKKYYASVIYQWIKQVYLGEIPTIFGDGEQSRDFIYIDDIIKIIVNNLDKSGVVDVGTGVNTSFNHVISLIKKHSFLNNELKYIKKPNNYISKIECSTPLKSFVSVESGIKKIIKSLNS